MNRKTSSVLLSSLLLLTASCDDVLTTDTECTASFIGVHPSAPLAVQGRPVWAAMRTSAQCTLKEIAKISVGLHTDASLTIMYHGHASLRSFTPARNGRDSGCAVFIWSGAGSNDKFAVTAEHVSGDGVIVSSEDVPGFKPGKNLPIWKVDDVWEYGSLADMGCNPLSITDTPGL